MAKAMGCHNLAAYVFWNYHEEKKGVFDFAIGNKNIAAFICICQQESMWELFRPGPYKCAKWDFSGLLPYLLKIPDIKFRCIDSRYMTAVTRYIKRLANELAPLQCTNGGLIFKVLAENEYGSYGNDREYMGTVKHGKQNGIKVPFYTADGGTPHMLEVGSLSGEAIGLDSGNKDYTVRHLIKKGKK